MQFKSFSCGNCNNDFAHSQSVIIYDKTNQLVASVKNLDIITISEGSWDNSCKLKTFTCDNCNKDLGHSQSVMMHEKIMQRQINL